MKNSILGISSSPNDIPIYLLEVYRQHNEDMEKLVGTKFSPAILQKYKCVYKKIQTFLKFKYNLSDIKLKDIKHNFLTDFETYLRIEGYRIILIFYIYTDRYSARNVDFVFSPSWNIEFSISKKYFTACFIGNN